MPHSHHSHSGQFCRHAQQGTSLEDVVREAINRGFKTFGLSEHCPRYRSNDLYPEESDLTPNLLHSNYLSFLDQAHRLKSKYASQIDLLVGIETDYITTIDLDGLETLLEAYGDRIEYVMGGIHHVEELPIDFDEVTWEKAVLVAGKEKEKKSMLTSNLDDDVTTDPSSSSSSSSSITSFFISYFDAQHTLLTRIQPTIIAHLDLCRLYTPSIRLDDEVLYPGVWERVKRNVETVVEYGGLFEVSSAALRKGWKTGYPGEEVLQLILRSGGKLCLSDDSHGPAYVGLNYTRLKTYLKDQNVKELWYLATPKIQTTFPLISSENSNVGETEQGGKRWKFRLDIRKMEGDWWDHPFWETVGR